MPEPDDELRSQDSPEHSSVSEWIHHLKEGDGEAAQRLWDRYFARLVNYAEKRLRNCRQGVLNAEDIAASVFESIWRGAGEGRLQNVRNRDELWWLLLALAQRKSVSHIRKETAQKRGGGAKTVSFDEKGRQSIESIISKEPTAEYLLALDEEYNRLLGLLRDDQLRSVAVLKLEGYSHLEIAERLDIATATVTRKFRLIRETWQRELST